MAQIRSRERQFVAPKWRGLLCVLGSTGLNLTSKTAPMKKLKNCLFGSCDADGNCAQIGYAIFRGFTGLSMAIAH